MSLNTILATTPNTTSGYVLRATGTTIGNSTIQDDGTNVAIGTTPGTYKLNVSGTLNTTGQVYVNTGGTDNQIALIGTAPSVRLANAITGATINGYIAMAGATNNYMQGAVAGDMCIGNQNNGKIMYGFGSGTVTPLMTITSTGVGIGTTPSAWDTNWDPVQMGSYGATVAGRTNDNSFFITKNVYFNGSDWVGVTTGWSQQMFFDNSGNTIWRNVNATANTVTGFNERFRIYSGGGVRIKQGAQIGNPPTSGNFYNGLTFENDTTTNAYSMGYASGGNFTLNYFDAGSTYSKILTIGSNGATTLGANLALNGSISNTGTGSGTYTQSVWYVDTSNQILFENGRTTDSPSGTGRTVYFTWRGGPSVGGGVQLQHGANAWAAYTSDERLKTIVANVDNGLEAIMKLNPIKYKWTKELETSKTVLGFTAQNVGEAIPEAMFKSWKDEELGDVLSYYQEYLTPYLVKAIQELNQTVQNQQQQINSLINR